MEPLTSLWKATVLSRSSFCEPGYNCPALDARCRRFEAHVGPVCLLAVPKDGGTYIIGLKSFCLPTYLTYLRETDKKIKLYSLIVKVTEVKINYIFKFS